jgi:hypothetical protein
LLTSLADLARKLEALEKPSHAQFTVVFEERFSAGGKHDQSPSDARAVA